ncbi:dihydropteroate synthase [Thermomicrobium sp. CFH 73360]|uniref:dihydropteroate synthase n=1 Tax=Thermomicrobium sp. CFH 73360 TaxID=2951987 RepID=UPI00207685DA|nr:dihydropteroate synthase [Thermomicrobium sp. CFH 73360]MCM8745681.1 dihydropteroate synthase [Thermomicrobium sp. CFH 73360]
MVNTTVEVPRVDAPPFDQWPWGRRTFVMGIINVTPDSFSGDGLIDRLDEVVRRARAMVEAGADILDVGGESTRPGHIPVPAEEELRRVIPAIRAIREALPDVPISVDTNKAVVAEAALLAGATMINDVRGLAGDPDMLAVAARAGVPVVIMHDLEIQRADELVPRLIRDLAIRIERALVAGVRWEHIIIDPGFGFGKEPELNLLLLRRLRDLTVLGRPILVGTSRKRTIGYVLGTPPEDRLEGTAATIALSIANGADIVRVHDVREMVRVVRMTDAVVRGTW